MSHTVWTTSYDPSVGLKKATVHRPSRAALSTYWIYRDNKALRHSCSYPQAKPEAANSQSLICKQPASIHVRMRICRCSGGS